MTRTFRPGDRAVVESPIFVIGDSVVRDHTDFPNREQRFEVGDIVTIETVPEHYETAHVSIEGNLHILAIEGLIHLDDIDALAAERSPAVDGFRVGDRVKVVSDDYYSCGDLAPGMPYTGKTATIVALPYGVERNATVALDDASDCPDEDIIALSSLRLLSEEPEEIPVRIGVRVFIGDVDITSLIDAHALKALVDAKAKESLA